MGKFIKSFQFFEVMKHTWVVTCFLLLLFFAAQLVGLKITQSYIDIAASAEKGELVWKELPAIAGLKIERPDTAPQVSIWYIIIAVLIGTLLILLIIKLGKVLLWKLWFYFAIVLCLQIAVAAFLPPFISLLIALAAGWFKVFKPNLYIHNLTELFVYGGLAAIFVPILNVLYSFILLIALSVYDMYAVWKSKHMVAMAKFQTKSGIFAGLLLPYKAPAIRGVKKQVRTAVLGGGDIGFPLIFSGTVLVASGFVSAILVVLGATAALFVLLLLSQKDRFYPAMPFLTLGCAVGYLATFLL
jgi:presenilin-like A22 family membrane protease